MTARWLREPLLHFLLLGAALFALYSAVGGAGDEAPEEIVVTRGQVATLREGFARTWLRTPSERELAGLIDDHVVEEIYAREASALGLDRDDTVIRRRLRQKMEFLSQDLAAGNAPGEGELEAWLAGHAERFARPARISFEQRFFSRERREDAERDAELLLARLNEGAGAATGVDAGDATLLPDALESADPDRVAATFGGEFAARLAQAPLDRWSGPLASAYGVHLVRVTRREESVLPTLDAIRAEVLSDWQAEQRARANDAALAQLRGRYTVRIEP